MIPTLYDYWVHDVEVLREKGRYELYPSNPYETVINTRPAISYYNDNNPDWLNVMIYYHVIAHIDFFQNNVCFQQTWIDDFLGKARADAQVIKELRTEKGRWIDYVIEFARGVDNLVNYQQYLYKKEKPRASVSLDQEKIDYFFDEYLQKQLKVDTFKFINELDRYNDLLKKHDEQTSRTLFLIYVDKHFLDFHSKFDKRKKDTTPRKLDVMQYLLYHSPKLDKDENEWMKDILQIVRDTSLYFQPQIRTKILNEGWASYWHEKLFMADPRLRGHEIEFSKINAGVVSMPRVGMNPYAIGLRMFKFLETKADRGMISWDYEQLAKFDAKRAFDSKTGCGQQFIFDVRKYYSDFTAINQFIDQDLVNEFKLFVTGKRINPQKQVWEYFVKSRKAKDFQKQMLDQLYHPPHITVDAAKTQKTGHLHLHHHFEGKELVREYIHNTMLGIEFLWGGKVVLDTHEIDDSSAKKSNREDLTAATQAAAEGPPLTFQRVVYSMEDKKLAKEYPDRSSYGHTYEDQE